MVGVHVADEDSTKLTKHSLRALSSIETTHLRPGARPAVQQQALVAAVDTATCTAAPMLESILLRRFYMYMLGVKIVLHNATRMRSEGSKPRVQCQHA